MFKFMLFIALNNGQIVPVDLSDKYEKKTVSRIKCEMRRLKFSETSIKNVIHNTPYPFSTVKIGTDYDNYVTKCVDVLK